MIGDCREEAEKLELRRLESYDCDGLWRIRSVNEGSLNEKKS